MPRFHTRSILDENGKQTGQENVLFTQAEEDEADAFEAASLAAQPLKDWEAALAATDIAMPRIYEDIIDTMSDTQKAKLPQIVLDRLAAKKTLRGQKPS